MQSNFAFCLKEVLRHEGGWADHPRDPGGATMRGITIGTYSQWKGRRMSKEALRAITDEEVAAIYKRNYWDKVRGDDLPSGLDFVAFDAAVNSGPARGAKWLQQGLGVAADGKIGPKTLAAAEATDAPAAIIAATNARLAFLRGLSTWPTFGKGWTRRVDDVRKKATTLAHVKETPVSVTRPAPRVNAASKPAQRASTPPVSRAKETAGTVAGGATGAGLVVAVLAFADDAAQAWRDLWIYVFSFFN
jgi:lysozyme family protein